jgi:tetratricopeptide (TPR) repeat protein
MNNKNQAFSRGRASSGDFVTLYLLTLCCLTLLVQTAALAVEPQPKTTSQQVIALYSAGKDAEAMTLVERALAKSPKNATLHYLKANILVAQDKLEAAINEYRAVLTLNPDEGLKMYCSQELNVLTTVKGRQPNARDEIASQANELTSNLQQQSALDARHIADEAARYQQRHENKTSQISSRMASEGSYDKDGEWYPAYSPQDIANMQAARALREQKRVEIYNRSSADLQAAAQAKARAEEDSAANLQSLIGAPVQPGEAALNPHGTNMYIRNYSSK